MERRLIFLAISAKTLITIHLLAPLILIVKSHVANAIVKDIALKTVMLVALSEPTKANLLPHLLPLSKQLPLLLLFLLFLLLLLLAPRQLMTSLIFLLTKHYLFLLPFLVTLLL